MIHYELNHGIHPRNISNILNQGVYTIMDYSVHDLIVPREAFDMGIHLWGLAVTHEVLEQLDWKTPSLQRAASLGYQWVEEEYQHWAEEHIKLLQ